MIQSKLFLGSSNNPADEQFNKWMEENNSHIKITNYDFKLGRCNDHALCIIYNDFDKVGGKLGTDPFTDKPVIEEPQSRERDFINLIREYYMMKKDKRTMDPHKIDELSKKIHNLCPYSTSYEQPGSYPSGSICEVKKCITCDCSTFESLLKDVGNHCDKFDEHIREWCAETKFGSCIENKKKINEIVKKIRSECYNYRMSCTNNSCDFRCEYFKEACNRAADEFNKGPIRL